ncbi:MAG: GDP-mannose 4,6-dehydratase [Nanoarchaeota archaeon]
MKALITGITGMDGTYLTSFLLSKGYEVYGLVRQGGTANPNWEVPPRVRLIECDITNRKEVESTVERVLPDEIYSLAAVSDYAIYTKDPAGSHLVNGVAPVLLMEAMRKHTPKCRMFQAGTCQSFGKPSVVPQDETTPFDPPNPYAISKAYAHAMARYYRSSHGLFVVNGILYNHESPLRVPAFVTRKISQGVAAIKTGKSKELVLGNLDATRDWGYAGDFVAAYWMTLQQKTADDYVIGTGERHTVREFVAEAFSVAGIKDWSKYVRQDERFMRGSDADLMQANPSKINSIGWKPTVGFKKIVKMMVENDLKTR